MPIARAHDALAAWDALGRQDAIYEAYVDLAREISVIGARSAQGEWSHFGPFDNTHRHHILDVTVAPADVSPQLEAEAIEATRRVMEALDFVGILCVEFFLARDGRLLINELAPRPHNSGHLTIDACRTSQFEQQVRAICGLPLGSPEMLQPAADGEPARRSLGSAANRTGRGGARHALDVKLHHGKTEPRPGRKMGHLTTVAMTSAKARAVVVGAREALRRRA